MLFALRCFSSTLYSAKSSSYPEVKVRRITYVLEILAIYDYRLDGDSVRCTGFSFTVVIDFLFRKLLRISVKKSNIKM